MSLTSPKDELLEEDLPYAKVYPSQREVARMLGIRESRLSKAQAGSVTVGGRGRHYAPGVVLGLAATYRQRTLNEVAGSLMEFIRESAPDYEPWMAQQLESFFAKRTLPAVDPARFLEEARRTLPRRLFEQVRNAYSEDSDASGEAPDYRNVRQVV